jgi:hypothetical protein
MSKLGTIVGALLRGPKRFLSRIIVIHHYAVYWFVMYRHTKKKCCRYVQIQTSDFSAFMAFYHECKRSSSPASHLPTTICIRHAITTHLLSMLNSVMSISISSVTNNLESTDNLAHCEETQEFCSNYGSRYQLSAVDVSD